MDDDTDTLEILSTYLHHHGAHIGTARTGREALRHLIRMRVDVLVIDYTMPGMTGVDLLRQIRTLPGEAERPTPAILCTAVGGMGAAALAAGFSGYLVKPMDPHVLVEEIARVAAA